MPQYPERLRAYVIKANPYDLIEEVERDLAEPGRTIERLHQTEGIKRYYGTGALAEDFTQHDKACGLYSIFTPTERRLLLRKVVLKPPAPIPVEGE